MATDTPAAVSDAVIYQCFARNHGPNGTLADVTADLPRIAGLGVDVLYLMPIQPIGVAGRKGSVGSPYAIRDYRAIDPALGSEEDFAALVDRANGLGMRVMLDVVYNHTAQDSVLVAEHPEFFHTDESGRPVTTVPAWTDIIDLKHPQPALTEYLIDVLKLWVDRGVRGFRCDVASLVPLEFWQQARAAIADHEPDVWWLTESPHPKWVIERREDNLPTACDTEMFDAFDLAYQYDLWSIWQAVARGQQPMSRFLEMVRWQAASLPDHARKLRFVENHDNYRIERFAPTSEAALAWTALMGFLPGPFMMYAGQESAATDWPSLFEPDPIHWGDYSRADFLRAVSAMVKQKSGAFRVVSSEPVATLAWGDDGGGLLGLFDTDGRGSAEVPLPDGTYENLLGEPTTVADGRAQLPGPATVLRYTGHREWANEHSPLLDVFLHVETLGEEL